MNILSKLINSKKVSFKEAYAVFAETNAIPMDHPIRIEPEYFLTVEALKQGVCRLHVESVLADLQEQVAKDAPVAEAEFKRLQQEAAAQDRRAEQLIGDKAKVDAKVKELTQQAEQGVQAAEALLKGAAQDAAREIMAGSANDMDARFSESAARHQTLRTKADGMLQAAEVLRTESNGLAQQLQEAQSAALALRKQAHEQLGNVLALKRDLALVQAAYHHCEALPRRTEAANFNEMGFRPALPAHVFDRLTVGAVGDWTSVSQVLAGSPVTDAEFIAALDAGRDILRRVAAAKLSQALTAA